MDRINRRDIIFFRAGKAVISNKLWESLSINADKEGVDTKTFGKKWLKRGYPVVDCRSNPQFGEIVIDQVSACIQIKSNLIKFKKTFLS